MISPRTQAEHDFYVIDCVNWVNVIALTPQKDVVLVRQFRAGTRSITATDTVTRDGA